MAQFHWADYLVFVTMLLVSMATGIYFACTGDKQRSTEEFLMAGRRMNIIPVSFSIFVSWMSAISFLGDPVECYTYGFVYIVLVLGYCIGALLAAFMAPHFHELNIVSSFEFIEIRYSQGLRILTSMASMVSCILWLGIATYAPALALSQASGIPVWASITLIGVVCTFYTSLGGMKAVLWADTIQMAIMLAGQIAIVVQGCIRMGGLQEVFNIAQRGGRINFEEGLTDFNPLSRTSLVIFLVGGIVRVFNPYISSQLMIQRYCTVKTPSGARSAVLLNIPMFAVMSSLIALNGLVMYAVYHDCDPLSSGKIQRADQMVPLVVLELLGEFPGAPGLFLATVFSASLSSLSSGMNGMAAMGLRDIAMPIYHKVKGLVMPPHLANNVAKALAVFFGVIVTGMSFLPGLLGESIFSLTSLVTGMVAGPMAGLFLIALLYPRIKTSFVYIAFAVAISVSAVLAVFAQVLPPRGAWDKLEVSTAGCDVTNGTVSCGGSASGAHVGESCTNVTLSSPQIRAIERPAFRVGNIHHMNTLLYNVIGLVLVTGIALTLYGLQRLWDAMCGYGGDSHYRSPNQKEFDVNEPLTPKSPKAPKNKASWSSDKTKKVPLSIRNSSSVRLSNRSAGRLSRHSFKAADNEEDSIPLEDLHSVQ